MKVYLIGIGIINVLYPKIKNLIIEIKANDERNINKRVSSIYAKMNENCIELI